jgi:hypothetical protein
MHVEVVLDQEFTVINFYLKLRVLVTNLKGKLVTSTLFSTTDCQYRRRLKTRGHLVWEVAAIFSVECVCYVGRASTRLDLFCPTHLKFRCGEDHQNTRIIFRANVTRNKLIPLRPLSSLVDSEVVACPDQSHPSAEMR